MMTTHIDSFQEKQRYILDHTGRVVPTALRCPECGAPYAYTWGKADLRKMRPNGACRECDHRWVLKTNEPITDK